MEKARLPSVKLPAEEPVLRVMPMPADVNAAGDIFGGWVMAHVDIAGAIPAMRRAQGRIATVAVNSFVFKQPISVGDLVSFYARIVRVGRTSITVEVEVYAERNPENPVVVKVTEATLTYVCLNPDGSKREVPPPHAAPCPDGKG
ncbi:MAG: acyl-CoA thioesterase [Rhodocyclaceae bacterium]|nr:acyl-CoA thioesterase [Rhodocyclaceae bacterium]